MKDATRRAISALGGVRPAARALGIHYATVSGWLRAGRVPAERVLDLEAAVQARVTRYELRPDVYGER